MTFFINSSNRRSLFGGTDRSLNRCSALLVMFVLIALSGIVTRAETEAASHNSLFSRRQTVSANSAVPLASNNVAANLTSGAASAAQTQLIPNGTYKITAKHSGRALDVYGRSLDNGAIVHQWDYVGNSNQKWQIELLGDGTYKITAVHSGKALDVKDWSSNNGAQIIQWDYHGGSNQRWRIEPVGNGYYKVLSAMSGKALDVKGWAGSNGARIQQWDFVGGDNQLWKFDSFATPEPTFVPAGYELVFSDEFGQSELDTSKWFTRYIYNNGYLDFLNAEQQRYRENGNHVMSGSSLQLTAKLDPSGGTKYTSGMVRSKTTFKYGYFEGRFKMPKGTGIWPAFWLNSDADANGGLQWPPEIDIFEYVVNTSTEHPNMIHTNVVNKGAQGNTILAKDPDFNTQWSFYAAPYDFSDGWHTIALLWDTDDTVTTFIDGRMIVKRSTKWVRNDGSPAPNAHVLINYALGGSWAGTVDESKLPSFLDVDYIRVYQKPDARNTGTTTIGHDLCPTSGC